MPGDDTFADLTQRLRAGDPAAEEAIFVRFQGRLIALARERLADELRGKTDPESVAQSALASFFLRYRDGQYDLANWPALWGLLACIALRKCGQRFEHFRAACRDVRREAGPPGADGQDAWEAVAREPSPEEVARFTEAVEEAMRGLDERERLMLTYRLQRYTPAEIAQKTQRTERTVYRLLDRVRDKLERMISDA
jgi:RNA polymerase sigma factor (sigma-70 family)